MKLFKKYDEPKSNDKPVKFIGWIYGDKSDESVLRSLGVTGRMIWRIHEEAKGKHGIFEHCEITLETARRLRNNYPVFWPGSFTGIDGRGRQTFDQPLSKGNF